MIWRFQLFKKTVYQFDFFLEGSIFFASYAQKLSRIFFRTLDVQENENGDKVIQYCYKGIEKTSSLYCKLIEFSESARHFQ